MIFCDKYRAGNTKSLAGNAGILFLLLGFLIISPVFYSCSKEETQVPEAIKALVEDLQAENPGCTCGPVLKQYKWHNEMIYVLEYRGDSSLICDWFPVFYKASGQKFTMDADSFDKFLHERVFLKNVWTCEA